MIEPSAANGVKRHALGWAGAVIGLAVGLACARAAAAHPGHGGVGLAAGLAHPLSGADHVLTLGMVGLWAAMCGGRARWMWPTAFVAAMLAGFATAGARLAGFSPEPLVIGSVICAGLLVATDARVAAPIGAAMVAAAGFAHGVAHRLDAPATTNLVFPLGFAATSLALQLAGLGLGAVLIAAVRRPVLRVLGLGVTAGGMLLALNG